MSMLHVGLQLFGSELFLLAIQPDQELGSNSASLCFSFDPLPRPPFTGALPRGSVSIGVTRHCHGGISEHP